jgi:hypothetical protein
VLPANAAKLDGRNARPSAEVAIVSDPDRLVEVVKEARARSARRCGRSYSARAAGNRKRRPPLRRRPADADKNALIAFLATL